MSNIERENQPKNPLEAISGKTQWCYFVTGDASYSLSPRMHNLALQATGLLGEFAYGGQSVSAEGLGDAIRGLRALQNVRAASIGTPHKLAVMKLCDSIDPAAKKMGAVNTIVIDREGEVTHITGYNTDYLGLLTPLKENTSIKGKRVAVIGSKGAARASLYAVQSEDPELIKIYNRTLKNGQELAKEFGVQAGSLDELEELRDFDIIIHATNQGMHGEPPIIDPNFIGKGKILVEWDYSWDIKKTILEQEAAKRGVVVIPGREILLYQGVAQFKMFYDHEAPVEVMRQVIYTA